MSTIYSIAQQERREGAQETETPRMIQKTQQVSKNNEWYKELYTLPWDINRNTSVFY